MRELNNYKLAEKDLVFVSYLANNRSSTQRHISAALGYSLGLTNIILKRLVSMGYIKTKQLNKRKVEYMLTPKGFIEKTKKSYNFFLKTINSFKHIKNGISRIVLEEYHKGERRFAVVGSNELADLAELAIRDLNRNDIYYDRFDRVNPKTNGVILYTDSEAHDHVNGKKFINIFKILSDSFS